MAYMKKDPSEKKGIKPITVYGTTYHSRSDAIRATIASIDAGKLDVKFGDICHVLDTSRQLVHQCYDSMLSKKLISDFRVHNKKAVK